MRRVVVAGGLLAAAAFVVPAGPAPQAADHSVAVVDSDFEPAQLQIAAGDAVIWTHEGTAPHTVTAADGSFDSHPQCSGSLPVGCMSGGQTFRREFPTAGTVAYYCKIHGTAEGGGMAGTIVVVAPAGGPAAESTTTTAAAAPAPTAPPTGASEASDSQSTATRGSDPTLQPLTTVGPPTTSSLRSPSSSPTLEEPGDEPVIESAAGPGGRGRGEGDDVWPMAGVAVLLLVLTGGTASTILAIRLTE